MTAQQLVFWIDEVGQGHNDLVGKKCGNLGEMAKAGMPIPPGFCLTIKACERFMEETGARQEIVEFLTKFGSRPEEIEQQSEASRIIRDIIESREIPRDMKQTVTSYYDIMCEKYGAEIAVSVRSAGAKSHPGQYETCLNVKGKKELLSKIVKVWSSTFNVRTIAAIVRAGLSIQDSPAIGAGVLKMLNVRSAGVGFSVHPTTGDISKIVIEGSWGLGEAVVSGAIIPDRYIVSKDTLEIIEKVVGEKKVWIVPKEQGVEQEEMPLNNQLTVCLADEEVKRIAVFANELESYFGVPQDIEWVVDADLSFPHNVILLQTRPVVGVVFKEPKSPEEYIIDEVMKKVFRR